MAKIDEAASNAERALLKAHRRKHGRRPTEKEQDAIDEAAWDTAIRETGR